MNSNGRLVLGTLLAGAVVTTLALAPAAAAQKPAQAPSTSTTLVFDKNQGAPANSRLSVYQGKKLWATYIAGSGLGITNDCVRAKGPMPDGNWKIKLKSRTYNGRLIKGYAVYLQDMKCS
ncbi:hypothetical protein [Streptomyces sp. NPDC059861]|uniref:hypothetical protein n=1 Tax=Streptomyces sp. NPDC059861 TaxID=3346974 RepID=UPI0036573A8E